MRALYNIDFLGEGISEDVIEEISYLLEPVNLREGKELFKAGSPCTSIYIVSHGQLNVYLNNTRETLIDTLYSGCNIGSYRALRSEDYDLTARAKTDCSLFRLPIKKIEKLACIYDDLDNNLMDYHEFLEESGIPYCDFKIYRMKSKNLDAMEKFKYGVRRIIRILESYKGKNTHNILSDFVYTLERGLVDMILETKQKLLHLNLEKMEPKKQSRRKYEYVMQLPQEQRHETYFLMILDRLDNFGERLNKQDRNIKEVNEDLSLKIEQLK